MLVSGEGGVSGPPEQVSLERRAESKAGLLTHPPTSQQGSLPDPSTLGATPTASQYSGVGASTRATNFPTGLFSVYKVNPGNQEGFTEPSVSDDRPVTHMPAGRAKCILWSGKPSFNFQFPSLTWFVTLK